MIDFIKIAENIYNFDNLREVHRAVVFIIRAYLHYPAMKKLYLYYQENDLKKKIEMSNPFVLEQVTRSFFYKDSTLEERAVLVKNHTDIIIDKFPESQACSLLDCRAEGILIWESLYQDKTPWRLYMKYDAGQRKEGMLGLNMDLGDRHLYQIIFWLSYNKSGETSLFIGALQGPGGEGARELIKEVTKYCYRYRTKNLMLYMMQEVARNMGVQRMYAVSNDGYYAQNHVRMDRKLKADFGTFWQEIGGRLTSDVRFYELPLREQRKAIEEVPARKRALYKKRFSFQDELAENIKVNMRRARGLHE